MKSFLIYRHGNNSANQPMTPVMAVGILEATDENDAREQAHNEFSCYANQFFSAVAEDDLTDGQLEDWNQVNSDYACGFGYIG